METREAVLMVSREHGHFHPVHISSYDVEAINAIVDALKWAEMEWYWLQPIQYQLD